MTHQRMNLKSDALGLEDNNSKTDQGLGVPPSDHITIIDTGGGQYSTITSQAWYQSTKDHELNVVNAVTKAYIKGREDQPSELYHTRTFGTSEGYHGVPLQIPTI
jgi:hypothetical protein